MDAYQDERRHDERGMERHRLADLRPGARGSAVSDPEVVRRLRDHLDCSPLAIALVDGASQVVRYANPAFLRLSGATAGVAATPTVLGRMVGEVVPASVAGPVSAMLRQVHRTGEPRHDAELTLDPPRADDGWAPIWSLTIWPASERGGHPDHLMLQVRDVTDQFRERRSRGTVVDELREINERLLIASLREEELKEQAQAADAAKAAFLATMSHELRTPLAAIIGYEELLADGITGPVTAAQQAQLARIKGSAVHLLALIDEVLTLARVEANREDVSRQPAEVGGDIVDVASTLVQPLAASKGLTFTVNVPEQPLTVDTDVLKVRQILVNLLGNAVKYSDAGGITLTVRTTGETVVFEVSDTGIGIAPENIDRVFDTFWQERQTATRTAGGTGLGLSVSRRLARLLGGDITVVSTVGRGSTFTLSLPLRTPDDSDARPPEA